MIDIKSINTWYKSLGGKGQWSTFHMESYSRHSLVCSSQGGKYQQRDDNDHLQQNKWDTTWETVEANNVNF